VCHDAFLHVLDGRPRRESSDTDGGRKSDNGHNDARRQPATPLIMIAMEAVAPMVAATQATPEHR
jgi:hypothetical protein